MKEILEYGELRSALASLADGEYREFSMKGIPSERPFIGVRIPLVREVVKRVPDERITEFLLVEPVAIEEVLARGMLICRLPYGEIVVARDDLNGRSWFDSQISYIDNWCTCDVFCSGVCRKIGKHPEEFLELEVDGLFQAKDEFAVRAGLVILKCGYVSEDYLAVIFDRVEGLASREEYYIRMAIAWLLAECFIKYPEVTLAYMKVSRLPRWTYNKTISKICDSYRVDEETKEMLRKMRR
ncbi:DNA alkylation repair protein [Candidatus Saccharibacteria bacterium]|nr:DNA alkylation repair protein [Candidatus Saccharibacteria bacterium]